MNVTLIAHTVPTDNFTIFYTTSDTTGAEAIIEFAGRTCYGVEGRMFEKEKYIEERIEEGHTSLLEHISFSFYIEGISRSCLAQLTRHRIASYSVRSLRYARPEGFVVPDTVADECDLDVLQWHGLMEDALEEYNFLTAHGVPKEDARYVLPLGVTTNLVMTANARSLRSVFEARALNPHAQWEIRDLTQEMLILCHKVAPSVFGDLVVQTEGQEAD
uniref:Putative thymidylate synthase n=1 Tax=viral metagenome TaxID=1070528 RepID=A0A6M3K765_9ZZZZ